MQPAATGVRARARALLKFVVRLVRLVFILILVALPIPMAPLVTALLRPFRRNLPAEVLRKK
ncbi:hypothetical protein [Pyxidicoccus xibeiensis]|uniref:hypothetical protein n=1 Tax=Pyxidicoccus xibeiensis TaxID=2906759 RepID=UPI0020A6E972|nr:hypothetical protein [Pyxidicoccus xibeiensis]MCP3136930.1 hypothetical protein [Pyxidicoccus xibeiensis]